MTEIQKVDFWEVIFNNERLSSWAESYCRMISDIPDVRNCITSYIDAITYYMVQGDDPILRKNVNLKEAAKWYKGMLEEEQSAIGKEIKRLAEE